MPIDASIPLDTKAPNAMSSLKDIMGIATASQALKTAKIGTQRQDVALQQEQGALDARNKVATVVSDPQYHDPDTGLFDLNRAAPAIVAADPKNYVASEVISKMAGANNDLLTVKKAALGLADTSRAMVGSTVGALATKPDLSKADIASALGQLKDQAPDAAPIIDVWQKRLGDLPDDPKVLQQVVMRARGQVMPAATQQSAQTPSGVAVSNGQQNTVVNTNPGAGPALPVGAPIPGTSVQQQVPPTAQRFNPATNAPEYVGPQPAAGGPSLAPIPADVQVARDNTRLGILQNERARWAAAPDSPDKAANLADIDKQIAGTHGGTATIQTGPKLGAAENAAGTADVVNKDWASTVELARTAPQDISVLQNIKQYARGAVMGVTSDRRAFIAGLAGLIHIDPAQIEKTNTDLLAKNSNMLALAGGDTNLARTMAEMANPNNHMTPEAAQEAANQIIAQRKLALAKQQYMGHFKGDQDQYTAELANFNKSVDPRVLQLPDMSRDEIARMKGAMSATEQREFGQKIRKMQSMGIVQ